MGPITLTSITRPNGAADKDGSQFGPENLGTWGTQGFDVRGDNISYNPSVNIANSLPLSVSVNRSIISSISRVETYGNNQLAYQAILTVLPSAPPAGSFRPFFGGTNKSIIHNKSDIDYTKMLKLAPVAGTPTFPGLEEAFRYPIITLGNSYPGVEYFVARYNCPEDGTAYGAAMSNMTMQALVLLNMNYTNAQKEALAINYIQMGLDTYGVVANGGAFPSEGGHNQGHKAPFVFAAHVLNDPTMQAACALYGGGTTISEANAPNIRFGEDQSTFYVTQKDIDTPRSASGYTVEPYPQSALGMPEWGPGSNALDGWYRKEAGYNWGRTYRHNCFFNLVNVALVAKLMGLESMWNHPAFFDYTLNRYAVIEANSAPSPPRVNGLSTLTTSMLAAYGGTAPPVAAVIAPVAVPSGGSYTTAQTVALTSGTGGATIHYTTDGSTPTAGSTVYSTPIAISANTTLKAVAMKSGMTGSAAMTSIYSITTTPLPDPSASSPVAVPGSGSFSSAQSVTLSSGTSGASIYYTTDGSTPTSGSTLYSTPITISANTTLKAVAMGSGMSSSTVMTSIYSITTPGVGEGVISLSTWPGTSSTMEPAQTSNFTISIKATPSSSAVDAQVGLSQGLPANYGAIAVIGRFNSSGRIDANNDNPYTAKNVLVYSAGVTYNFEFSVNMLAKTYDLKVTPEGGIPTVIAENYAFRSTAPSEQLTNVVIHHDASSAGTISADGIEISNLVTAPAPPQGLRVVE